MATREPTELTLRIRKLAKIERLKDKIEKAENRVGYLKGQLSNLTVDSD